MVGPKPVEAIKDLILSLGIPDRDKHDLAEWLMRFNSGGVSTQDSGGNSPPPPPPPPNEP